MLGSVIHSRRPIERQDVRRRHPRRNAVGAVLACLLLASCSAGADGPAPTGPTDPPPVFVPHTPAASPAHSFTAGSYIVGQDVELGRYSADANAGTCRWLQRDSSGALLDRSGEDRPTQVLTLSARGSELVVAGAGCSFARLP